MSRPIDYSKWDKIGADDDDSSGDEGEQQRGPPRVTKFDAPMSVTIGGSDGSEGGGMQQQQQQQQQGGGAGSGAGAAASAAPAPRSSSAASATAASASAAASSAKVEDVAENGDTLEAYAWRQGRQEAVLTVWCAPDTRAKDVAVAFDAETRKLRVAAAGQVLLEGVLANPVKVDEDTGVDWELIGGSGSSGSGGSSRRAVRLSFPKATPRPDMVHWWSRAMVGDREIDTSKIQGRKHNFQQAWEEAQAMFQESVRKRAAEGPVAIP